MKIFRDSLTLDVPVDRVFQYYIDLENLARMTTPDLQMRVTRAELPLRVGARVSFALAPRSLPIEVRWDAEITAFEQNRVFEDTLVRGPFDHWVHRHEFRPVDDQRTEVTDTIEVGAPLGMFGRMAERFLIAGKIEEQFRHRARLVRRELASPAGGTA